MSAKKVKRKEREQTWISKELAPLFGSTPSLVTYIPHGMTLTEIKAAKTNAKAAHYAELAAVAALPVAVKAEVIEAGGWLKYRDRTRDLQGLVSAAIPVPALMAPDHAPWLQTGEPLTPAQIDQLRVRVLQFQEANRAQWAAVPPEAVAAALPIALEAAPAAAFTFLGLFQRWAGSRVKAASARNYKRTVDRLEKCFGNVDVRKLRRPDARRFKDWLQQNVNGTASQKADIGHAFTLFDTLDSHDLPDGNPFVDAKKLRREIGHVTKTKGAFSPAQLKALLSVAERHRFGDTRQRKDHDAVLWILKVLIYTGARIGESAGLTTADVRREGSIAYLHFRRDAVKAKQDEDKSRKVPLHKDIADAFEAYAKSRPAGPVFGDGELADWVISYFPAFIRDHAAAIGVDLVDGTDPKTGAARKVPVDGDGQELTLHRIRASFQNAAEEAELDKRKIDDIVGHMVKTIDGKYRKQLPLRVLKPAIDLVRPLGE